MLVRRKGLFTLLKLLTEIGQKLLVYFEITTFHLDQGEPNYPNGVMRKYLDDNKVNYLIEKQNSFLIVTDSIYENKTCCGLCSRLRRGIIYRVAKDNGFTKIALGHHLDDIVETLFLNMFYGPKLKAMPPKLISDDGQNIVIRPLLTA